jgi:porphobilinogen synthase
VDLVKRPRRLRILPRLAALTRETRLSPDALVMPYFARAGRGERREIPSMPGHYQWPVARLAREARRGPRTVLLFGIPRRKDARGSDAYARGGVIQQAVRALKDADPGLTVITDVCLCEYTDHGHCGVLSRNGEVVDNDRTLELLGRIAVSHAEAGADLVAPSGMMDGAVHAIRAALDQAGFRNTPILSYAAKYASAFYGPFRQAAESAPAFGDRSAYQMDPANSDEALREIGLDLEEGADIVMVKPALAYLDVLRRAKERFHAPMAAYNVSGEYAMVAAAARQGWLDERRVALEILTSIRRAGADIIVTYWAKDASQWMT